MNPLFALLFARQFRLERGMKLVASIVIVVALIALGLLISELVRELG